MHALKDNNAPFHVRLPPVKPAERPRSSAVPEASVPSRNSTLKKIDDHAGVISSLVLSWKVFKLRCYTILSFSTQLVSPNIFACYLFQLRLMPYLCQICPWMQQQNNLKWVLRNSGPLSLMVFKLEVTRSA